jgi:hypothetical protein
MLALELELGHKPELHLEHKLEERHSRQGHSPEQLEKVQKDDEVRVQVRVQLGVQESKEQRLVVRLVLVVLVVVDSARSRIWDIEISQSQEEWRGSLRR